MSSSDKFSQQTVLTSKTVRSSSIDESKFQHKLTTRQQEILRAINSSDYQFMLDMGVLEDDTDLNFSITDDGITPLMLACSIGKLIIIDLLVKNPNIRKNQTDGEGYNCLYYATFYGHKAVIERLKEADIPYVASLNGTTCLHVAVRKGHMDIVNYYLNKTTEERLNELRDSGLVRTLLEKEVKEKANEQKKIKWEEPIDVNEQKEDNGVTPIFIAAKMGNLAMVELLYKFGAELNKECQLGNQSLYPILLASKLSFTPIVRFIVENSLDKKSVVNCKMSQSGSTSVHMVAYIGDFELLCYFVQNGANLLEKNKFNDTVLHIAIRQNQRAFAVKVVNYINEKGLLQGKQTLDIENNQEKLTPYMLAVLREQKEVADALLATGKVNKSYKNQEGEQVETIAKKMGLRQQSLQQAQIQSERFKLSNSNGEMLEEFKRSDSPDALNLIDRSQQSPMKSIHQNQYSSQGRTSPKRRGMDRDGSQLNMLASEDMSQRKNMKSSIEIPLIVKPSLELQQKNQTSLPTQQNSYKYNQQQQSMQVEEKQNKITSTNHAMKVQIDQNGSTSGQQTRFKTNQGMQQRKSYEDKSLENEKHRYNKIRQRMATNSKVDSFTDGQPPNISIEKHSLKSSMAQGNSRSNSSRHNVQKNQYDKDSIDQVNITDFIKNRKKDII